MMAGFLLPHDSSIARGDYMNYIMTIDELESKTGIDFFPNLVQVIGADAAAKLEAAEPAKFWK